MLMCGGLQKSYGKERFWSRRSGEVRDRRTVDAGCLAYYSTAVVTPLASAAVTRQTDKGLVGLFGVGLSNE